MAQSLPIVIDPNLIGSGAVAGVYLSYALGRDPSLPKMSILGMSTTSGEVILSETGFQYWPETIEDSIEIGWEFTSLPATSHGLAHWTQNGGRTITFEVTFARDMQYNPKPHVFLSADPDSEGVKPYNGNPDYMIKYLRAFAHPETKADGTVLSPPVAFVNLEGSSIGADGGDSFAGVMTQCDVSYKRFTKDSDGTSFTRLATVSLAFKEVIQNPSQPGKFQYHNLDTYKGGMDVVSRNIKSNTPSPSMKYPF
tara:strand:- start:282 stop:1040 length:759 start_codon:yes stop_codon:yes gene_type:complete